jgi:galactose mutarotase-like enzyme
MRYACNMQNSDSIPLITLTYAGSATEATIAPSRGALVTSLKIDNRELLYLDEGTFRDLSKNVRGGVPALFPSPGKLENDAWRYQDKSGAMKQHGFARTEVWTPVRQTSNSLSCALESNSSTLSQYPWTFKAELEFALRAACLRITFRVHNTSNKVMPFGVGYHPYFRADDKTRARIDTDATQAFDNRAKRTGWFTGFDFTQDEVDIHLLNHRTTRCTLALGDGSRIEIRTSNHFSLWVVWTLAGKEFMCLEPWTSPGNAINSGERLLILAPGQHHESWIEIALGE